MPYRWTRAAPEPEARLILWPHQSMTGPGFAGFIGVTAIMLALPLAAVLGSPVAWVLMVFFGAALAAIWWAIMRNRADRQMHEELTLSPEWVRLAHQPAHGGAVKEWEANPYWVRVQMRDDGPVDSYLTLKGNGREVEIGTFLSEDERKALFAELDDRIRSVTRA